MIATRPAKIFTQSGGLDPACRVVDPDRDPVYALWWSVIYRDGTERRQYNVHGGHLIQTMFGLLSPLYVRKLTVWNGPPWGAARQWDIAVPPGSEVDIHYDAKIALSSDIEVAKVLRSGTIVLPSNPSQRYRIRRDRIYTFGWFDVETKRGEFVHADATDDPIRAWSDNRRFV